jgi:uncharacterized repeat protein (TIGR03803 family)
MKTFTKQLFLLPALIAALGLLLTGRATAQPVTTLHTFPVSVLGINTDGAKPLAGPILSGNTLYGTAYIGGNNGKGAVFAVNTDSSGFTNLHSFTTLLGPFPPTNSEGADPRGGLLISGNTLYGTANAGGSSGVGTVFAVSTNGTGFTNLYNFSGGDDGVNPQGGLVLAGSTLYGTTFNGGTNGNGTVFAINTNGAGFTKLYSFTAKNYNGVTGGMTNSDGTNPYAGLILSGGTLYGTASTGGDSDFGSGTVVAINTNGAGFTNLHSLTYADGASPFAGLILSGKTLYGAAAFRGSSGYGTLFAVNTNGTGFTNYYNFSGGSDGAYPEGSVILSGNTLYGTAEGGDSSSANGNVFSLALVFAPRLNIIRSGTNVIVTWTNTASGFTLLFTTNLVSPAVWTTNSPLPVVINGQNTVTNPIAGTKKFYRLVK